MSIQLLFQFDDYQGAMEFLRNNAGPRAVAPVAPTPVAPVAPTHAAPEAAGAVPTKPKRGRPKNPALLIIPAPVSPQVDATIGSGKVNLDNVRAALSRVNEGAGLPVARALLAQFGASRISDLKADKYAEFIVACEDNLK